MATHLMAKLRRNGLMALGTNGKTSRLRRVCLGTWLAAASTVLHVIAEPTHDLNQAAAQYLALIENFAGFAEDHWNEKEQSYDAAGSGVTWARGNGGVC